MYEGSGFLWQHNFLKLAVISTLTNKLNSCPNKELRKGEVRKQILKENLSSGYSKPALLWIESDQSLHYLSIPFSCSIMQPSWLKQRRLSSFCKCLTATQSLKIIIRFRFAALIPSTQTPKFTSSVFLHHLFSSKIPAFLSSHTQDHG